MLYDVFVHLPRALYDTTPPYETLLVDCDESAVPPLVMHINKFGAVAP